MYKTSSYNGHDYYDINEDCPKEQLQFGSKHLGALIQVHLLQIYPYGNNSPNGYLEL